MVGHMLLLHMKTIVRSLWSTSWKLHTWDALCQQVVIELIKTWPIKTKVLPSNGSNATFDPICKRVSRCFVGRPNIATWCRIPITLDTWNVKNNIKRMHMNILGYAFKGQPSHKFLLNCMKLFHKYFMSMNF
jgi:hypothetical protein